VGLSPLGTAAITNLLYQPQMIDDGDCGAIGGIKIGSETEVLGENLPQRHFLCPPQISHDQTRAAAVGNQLLTAWAMARPFPSSFLQYRVLIQKQSQLTNCMEPSSSWEADSRSATRGLTEFCRNWSFIVALKGARHWSLFWASGSQYTPNQF
jgi:hypothetical protein